jgi:hypothetical protein
MFSQVVSQILANKIDNLVSRANKLFAAKCSQKAAAFLVQQSNLY